MKTIKLAGVITVVAGLIALAVLSAPAVHGQTSRTNPSVNLKRQIQFFGGVRIGASVRDLEEAERKGVGGVFVEEVNAGSPAEKAGLRRADIITRYDGENVRSVMQFTRLVQETPVGRTVNTTVVRDGRSTELSLVPEEGSRAGAFFDGDRLGTIIQDQIRERVRQIPFDLDLDVQVRNQLRRGRLGVSVEELTPQLATYFGAKDGVLVSSVADDSPASRAGLRAGDVIVSLNGQNVGSSSELTRSLREVRGDAEVTVGVVRDKKEMSLKTKLDDVQSVRPLRPIRPVRSVRPVGATPA